MTEEQNEAFMRRTRERLAESMQRAIDALMSQGHFTEDEARRLMSATGNSLELKEAVRIPLLGYVQADHFHGENAGNVRETLAEDLRAYLYG